MAIFLLADRVYPNMLKWFFGLSPHLRVAILVAPILTIIGYGAADFFLIDGAKSKREVEFVALSQVNECHFAGGSCQLKRDDFKAEIKRLPASSPDLVQLEVRSNMAMRGVKMSLVQGTSEAMVYMAHTSDTAVWIGEFPEKALQNSDVTLRLAIARVGLILHAEVDAQF